MAFLGFFKSKQEKEMEGAFHAMREMLFPGGEKDLERDCQRVSALIGHKVKTEKLKGFVSGSKALLRIAEEHDEDRFVSSFITRSEGLISKDEAYAMYAYLEGEATYYDNITTMMKKMGGNLSATQEMFGDTPWIYAKGSNLDHIAGGHGEYGLTVSNPVPTISARGSDQYLAALRINGRPVESSRLGSTSSEVTPGSVDIYQLSSGGAVIGKIYICPYHKKNSRIPPRGFTYQRS